MPNFESVQEKSPSEKVVEKVESADRELGSVEATMDVVAETASRPEHKSALELLRGKGKVLREMLLVTQGFLASVGAYHLMQDRAPAPVAETPKDVAQLQQKMQELEGKYQMMAQNLEDLRATQTTDTMHLDQTASESAETARRTKMLEKKMAAGERVAKPVEKPVTETPESQLIKKNARTIASLYNRVSRLGSAEDVKKIDAALTDLGIKVSVGDQEAAVPQDFEQTANALKSMIETIQGSASDELKNDSITLDMLDSLNA